MRGELVTQSYLSLLVKGLILALTPAFVFVPVFAFLTVCPPQYGPALATLFLIGCCVSEWLAVRYLFVARRMVSGFKAALAIIAVFVPLALALLLSIWLILISWAIALGTAN